MPVSYQEATESEEYTQGVVEYFRGGSEVDEEEGLVTQNTIHETEFAIVVKKGQTIRIPVARVLRIRLQQ